VRVEVIKIQIQISLQIIKRFEKEKDFPSSYSVAGRNPAVIRVRPNQPLLPLPFSIFHAAWLHLGVGLVEPAPASLAHVPVAFHCRRRLPHTEPSLRRHCGSPSPCSSFGRTTSRVPATTIARRRSKVSEMSFPCRCGAIVENRGPKCRMWPSPVSHHRGPALPPSGAPPPSWSRP
jgi:hypothetical protein